MCVARLGKDADWRLDAIDTVLAEAKGIELLTAPLMCPAAAERADVKGIAGQRSPKSWQFAVDVMMQEGNGRIRVEQVGARRAGPSTVQDDHLISGSFRYSNRSLEFDRAAAEDDRVCGRYGRRKHSPSHFALFAAAQTSSRCVRGS